MTHPPVHQNAPPSLRAWLDSVDAAREPTVRDVRIDGVRSIIKRRRPGILQGAGYALRYVRALFLGVGCKIFLGEFPRPGVLLRNGLAHEAERLAQLLQAGCRVPEVWWQEQNLLVLEYVGPDLAHLIRKEDSTSRLWLTRAAAADMAAFHARGLWHGGAQIRNLTLQDGEIWRIDFEENIGATLSRPLAQAYDLFQMLASLVSLRKLDDGDARTLGKLALEVYLESNPDPEVKACLMRLARVLCAIAMPLRPLLRRFPSRDVQGFFRVADILQPLISKS
ncbi:RIO1 family regulatory kinase/ATPase [Achromobacter arsenitoxydans]|uniref:RIO1 family regulatory kinase/ATPase domain-containing protein n=1 Tax=Achromobacter arsenitoxydans TaxID=1147684 RepID=UPI0005BD72B9|nr:RIO1 family regulatory kinase/ATPase [Achromobacter arsenitoxydans]